MIKEEISFWHSYFFPAKLVYLMITPEKIVLL